MYIHVCVFSCCSFSYIHTCEHTHSLAERAILPAADTESLKTHELTTHDTTPTSPSTLRISAPLEESTAPSSVPTVPTTGPAQTASSCSSESVGEAASGKVSGDLGAIEVGGKEEGVDTHGTRSNVPLSQSESESRAKTTSSNSVSGVGCNRVSQEVGVNVGGVEEKGVLNVPAAPLSAAVVMVEEKGGGRGGSGEGEERAGETRESEGGGERGGESDGKCCGFPFTPPLPVSHLLQLVTS